VKTERFEDLWERGRERKEEAQRGKAETTRRRREGTNLGSLVRLKSADPHLGHDLENSVVGRVPVVLQEFLSALISLDAGEEKEEEERSASKRVEVKYERETTSSQSLPSDLRDDLHHQVRTNSIGSVSDENTKMMDLSSLVNVKKSGISRPKAARR